MKIKVVMLMIIAFLVCSNNSLVAQEQIQLHKISLDEAISTAINNNLTIQKQQESNNIYKLRAKKEFTYLLPEFSVASDYAYNTQVKLISMPGSLSLFPTNKKNLLNTSVGFVQPISDLYKYGLKYKQARENFEASQFETDIKKDLVVDEVSNIYFDIIRQKKIIDLTKQNIVTLEAYYKLAKDRNEAGTALQRDYMKVQIEIDNAKHNLLIDNNAFSILTKRFKELLGIDLDVPIEISELYSEKTFDNKTTKELQQIAIENRPELKQLKKEIEVAKLDKKIQLAEYIPQIDFYLSYINQVGNEFSPDNNLIFGVNAKYDFWQWNRKFYNFKEKESETKTKELDLQQKIISICIEVESQLNKVNEAKDLISVSKHTVELSEENVRISNDRYSIGLALITDLLDDQMSLLDSQVKLISSQLAYQKTLIDLDKTLGVINLQ